MLLLWLSLFRAETEEELEKMKEMEVPVIELYYLSKCHTPYDSYSFFYINSMRKTSWKFNSETVIQNIWELCGEQAPEDEIQYWETINTAADKYGRLKKAEKNCRKQELSDGACRYDFVTDTDDNRYKVNIAEYREERDVEIRKGNRKGGDAKHDTFNDKHLSNVTGDFGFKILSISSCYSIKIKRIVKYEKIKFIRQSCT